MWLYVAFITCLLKPRNFPLALLFILVHFLVIDAVSGNGYLLLGIQLGWLDWLLLTNLIALFFLSITVLTKNFALIVIFLLTFMIKSYIYIFDPNQAANFLWHGQGKFYYNNIFSIDLGYWLSISVYIALVIENVRAYPPFTIRLRDHIINSHREFASYLKNETISFYSSNKKILFDPYFKKAGEE